jgi:hypothetical protein
VPQIAAEEQSGKLVPHMGVRMKQRRVTGFLHAENMAPVDIHRSLNVYGDEIPFTRL